MRRRRRRSSRGAAAPTVALVAGLWWVWSQSWGRPLLLSATALLLAAAVARIATASRRRQRRLRGLATMDGLLALTPAAFEHEVADLLRSLGFTAVEVTGTAGDLQADILARDADGRETIVQCKRYAPGRTVGSPVLQSFIGMARIHHDCERAMFVTTGSFTQPACALADEHDIELIDGDDLVALFAHRAEAFA